MNSGIYAIRHKDGRIYIGSAVNLLRRKREHFTALRRGEHRNFKLQRAWHADGEKSFTFKIIKRCSVKKLIETEQHFIEKYDSCNQGFNIAPEAGKVTFGRSYRLRQGRSKGRNRS